MEILSDGYFQWFGGVLRFTVWGLWDQYKKGYYAFTSIVTTIIVMFVVGAVLVLDMTKSVAYITPLALLVLHRTRAFGNVPRSYAHTGSGH